MQPRKIFCHGSEAMNKHRVYSEERQAMEESHEMADIQVRVCGSFYTSFRLTLVAAQTPFSFEIFRMIAVKINLFSLFVFINPL